MCIYSIWDDQDEAVQKVVEFMNIYSISQEDFDTIVELSKFQVPLHTLIAPSLSELPLKFHVILWSSLCIRGIQIRWMAYSLLWKLLSPKLTKKEAKQEWYELQI